jgi:hypothetical protein
MLTTPKRELEGDYLESGNMIEPGGKPASLMRFARYKIDKGVCSAALSTTVFPHASAGPNFQAAIARG